MLKVFRQQGITSAVYGLIIVATVVVFVVQFRPGAQGTTGSIRQECAAQIRGRCIDPKDYTAELMLVAPGRMIEASQMKALGVRKYVQEGLVERTLLVQDAERLGITVSEDELNNELMAGRAHVSLPVEQARMLSYTLRLADGVRLLPVTSPDNKAFDYKVYDRVVRQFTNRSPTEFKAMQREEVLAARMRDLVKGRVRVGDDEAFTTYQREKSSATIRFATFRRNWFAKNAL
ncbi:MAG: SurA N-terminal domain-containing protein, partial [Polyangiaceae bacterium]